MAGGVVVCHGGLPPADRAAGQDCCASEAGPDAFALSGKRGAGQAALSAVLAVSGGGDLQAVSTRFSDAGRSSNEAGLHILPHTFRCLPCAGGIPGQGQVSGVPYATQSAKARAEFALAEVPSPEGSLMIPYEIRRNARSRYIRLTLGEAGQARLSVPRHCSQSEALAFLRTQGEWLQRQLQKIPARVSLRSHFAAHPQLYALAHSLQVKLGRTRGRSYYLYSLRPAEILFQLHSAEGTDAETELLAQLRAFAAEVIPLRTRQLAEERGIRYSRVSVRDQSSRWGSCSTTGTVSLNWRLVLLRPHLQDHVILHELAHLREMNHSERFWNLLRSYDPYCDAHNGQLNVAATKVMALGRT